MNEYMIVTNDAYELPVTQDLIGAKAVAEYLGLSVNRVRKNLCTGIWNHKAKYKAVLSGSVVLSEREREKRHRERVRNYDLTHDRSEYFRQHYQKKKEEKKKMSKELEAARALVKILEEKEKSNRVELATLKPGEVFKIGEYDFIVLEQSEGTTAVISKGLMAKNKKFDSDTRNYKESSLKKLIESDIQPIIEAAVGAENLVEHEVDLTSVDMQKEFDSCVCKVRPITFDEARKYNNLIADKNIGDWWWTCTPWSTAGRGCPYSMLVVSPSGDFSSDCCDFGYGVRPFCILKSNIFVSKGE